MKKYVQEATDINIWTSIKNNTFGRNKDIKAVSYTHLTLPTN